MARTPLVSVIMPCYNAAPYVAHSVRSVLAQDMSDWELIIVDDGSRDGSVARVRETIGSDPRVRLELTDSSWGAATARNVGIALARGRYIAFLDADDWWEPTKLSTQLTFMEEVLAPFSYTAYEKVNAAGVQRGRVVQVPAVVNYGDLLRSCVIGCSTVILDQVRLGRRRYMPGMLRTQDYALWLNILREGHLAYGLEQPLTYYRERRGSLSSNKLIKAAYQWRVYREQEGFSATRAVGYFLQYAWFGVRKRLI